MLLLLATFASSAQAVPVDDEFEATGTVLLEGDGALRWGLVGATLQDDETNRTAWVTVPYAHLQVYEVNQTFAGERTGVGPDVIAPTPVLQRKLFDGDVSGTLRIDLDPTQLGVVRLKAGGDGLGATTHASTVVSPLGTRYQEHQDSTFTYVHEVEGRSIDIRGPHTLAAVQGGLTDLREVTLFAVGGTVVLPTGETFELPGRHLASDDAVRDPWTGSGVETYTAHVLVVEAPHAAVEGNGTWKLAATDLEGVVDGRVEWRGVLGGITFGEDAADEPEVLVLQGHFDVDGAIDSGVGAWGVRGDANQVLVDLETRFRMDTPVVVGGLTFVGLAVAAVAYGRDLLALAVGRLSDPLSSTTRQDLLRIIHAHQPIGLPELQDATGLGRSTLRYHLGVLQAAHVLQTVVHAGRGRNATFVLNGGSLTFGAEALDAEARPGTVVGTALSAASTHPVRKAVFETLLARGPSTPADLRSTIAARRDRPLSASTLSYHLGVLADAGLVRSERIDGRKAYRVCIDGREARGHQYRSYLRRPEWKDVVHAILDRGPLAAADLVEVLVGAGHAPRSATAAVDDLRRRCVLEPVGERLRVHPSIAAALRPQGAP